MVDMANFANQREYFMRRLSGLQTERSSFEAHWKDLAQFIQPRRGRFFTSDRNKGDKRNQKIINSKATMALRSATSGLMANLTSPARPWFKLEPADFEMMEFGPVKLWLHAVEERMHLIFNQSNLYNALPVAYSELLLFGTAALSHLDDFQTVARFFPHTIGSYYLAQNDNFQVDTIYREFELTVKQVVERYGLENISRFVREQWDHGHYMQWVPIVQAVEPNPDFRPASDLARHRRFISVHFEKGIERDVENPQFLRRSGFNTFPTYGPRWETTGEDIYGTNCPGMTALGDVKQLQMEERRKAQAIDKMVNPPLKGPGVLKNTPVSALPGGLVSYDEDVNRGTLQPIYQVEPRIAELMEDLRGVEVRIDEAFYVNLFLAISAMEGVQPRNQLELSQRNEEKLLMLGPVIERLQNELLDPLITRQFEQMVENTDAQGMPLLPPPPQELSEMPLRVRYISTLAMAQRAVGTGVIERTAGFVGSLAAGSGDPTVWDKFNQDQAVDRFSQLVGTAPDVIRTDDEVAEIRQARIQAQQEAQEQAEQQAAIQGGASALKDGAQALRALSDNGGVT
jgi:hypothetical protein